jgi:GH15 family glucan-1,4-alpha-glucosidase
MNVARRTLENPDRTVAPGAPETALYSEAAFPGEQGTVLAPVGSTVRRIPGTPFLDPDSGHIDGALHPSVTAIEQTAAEFSAAPVPGREGPFADMAETAASDLLALRQDNGAVLGAGSSYWRFVWPRDNGLAAAALSLCGYQGFAEDALRYVYEMQEEDGQFEARYLPDGSGQVPDDRGRQHDGIGYTLWATDVVTARSSATSVDPVIRAGALRALRAGIALLDPRTGLPAPSQDYWEMDLETVSLGVAAPLLAGIEAGQRLASRWGEPQDAEVAQNAADALAEGITRDFGPVDYQRFTHGGGRDASIALLLPPFRHRDRVAALDEITAAWRRAMDGMRIANGGLRPGEQWEDDQTAWTPQISLFSMTAAALEEREIADDLLTWLDQHRTSLGCLPEKVTAAGTPAAVAPINCVAAAALLALAQLEGRTLLL